MRSLSQDPHATIEIKAGRARLMLHLVTQAGFFVACIYFWLLAPGSYDRFWLKVGSIATGMLVGGFAARMFWPFATLTLSPAGLSYRYFAFRSGQIPWSAIGDVDVVPMPAANDLVLLDLSNTYERSEELSKKFGRPMRLHAGILRVGARELADAIRDRIHHYVGPNGSSLRQGYP